MGKVRRLKFQARVLAGTTTYGYIKTGWNGFIRAKYVVKHVPFHRVMTKGKKRYGYTARSTHASSGVALSQVQTQVLFF